MQHPQSIRLVGLGLAGILVIAAALTSTAMFEASAPGSDLKPVGGAERVVSLVQNHETVLWKALNGTVSSYQVLGWPVSDGVHDLGGAMVLARPDSGTEGVIVSGEPPKSIEFTLGR